MLLFRSRVRHWGGRNIETAMAVRDCAKISRLLQLRGSIAASAHGISRCRLKRLISH